MGLPGDRVEDDELVVEQDAADRWVAGPPPGIGPARGTVRHDSRLPAPWPDRRPTGAGDRLPAVLLESVADPVAQVVHVGEGVPELAEPSRRTTVDGVHACHGRVA